MKKFILAAVLCIVIFAGGISVGWLVTRPDKAGRQVTSQTILSALRERGFLVTETSVSNVSATIKTDQASIWKRLLWGQEVRASGVVEINLGVDLAKTTADDVVVSPDKITVRIPKAQIFNSRLVGDVNVENKQGILKRLLENDDGYNQAMAELIKQAEGAVTSTKMIDAADSKAKDEIGRLVQYLAPEKKVEVIFQE